MAHERKKIVTYTRSPEGFETKDDTEIESTHADAPLRGLYFLIIALMFSVMSNFVLWTQIGSLRKDILSLRRFDVDVCLTISTCHMTKPEETTSK